MSAVNTYDVGDTVIMHTEFRVADVLTDPTAVVCQLKDPAGTLTTPSNSKISTGIYEASVDVATAGTWRFRWTATGTVKAAEESWFLVRPRMVGP